MALTVYLDASVLVALFTEDTFTARADALLHNTRTIAIISDFAAAEFASAIAREVRIGQIGSEVARDIFSRLDAWIAREIQYEHLISPDIAAAASLIRRLDLVTRAPDAINIAIAQRIGADLATFDEQMGTSARALGVTVLA